MKVEKYKRISGSKYKVIINDLELVLYDDIIIKHQLLLNSDIDKNKLDEIIKDNDIYSYYMLALNYIKKRLRSKKEIVLFLNKKDINPKISNQVVKMLENNNCINDGVFTKAYIHDKISYSNDGPSKIRIQLDQLGIEPSIVNNEILVFNDELQFEKINKYIAKQIKSNRNKSTMVLKNNILNNLIKQGYDKSIIVSCLENINVNDDELYEKEYQKAYQKISQKYSGHELEYRIKQKMYQKGFRK